MRNGRLVRFRVSAEQYVILKAQASEESFGTVSEYMRDLVFRRDVSPNKVLIKLCEIEWLIKKLSPNEKVETKKPEFKTIKKKEEPVIPRLECLKFIEKKIEKKKAEKVQEVTDPRLKPEIPEWIRKIEELMKKQQ